MEYASLDVYRGFRKTSFNHQARQGAGISSPAETGCLISVFCYSSKDEHKKEDSLARCEDTASSKKTSHLTLVTHEGSAQGRVRRVKLWAACFHGPWTACLYSPKVLIPRR